MYRELQQYDDAMLCYKKAEQFVSQTTDVDIKGLIQYNMGNLLEELLYEKEENLINKNNELQKAILQQFDVAKKILLLNSRTSQKKGCAKIYFEIAPFYSIKECFLLKYYIFVLYVRTYMFNFKKQSV